MSHKSIAQHKYEKRAAPIVEAFRKSHRRKQDVLENLENAWKFYASLETRDKSLLRSYTSENGGLTFKTLLEQIVNYRSWNSNADKVGQHMLILGAKEEIRKMSIDESEMYTQHLKIKQASTYHGRHQRH